jgi:probable rRNA maturation factor
VKRASARGARRLNVTVTDARGRPLGQAGLARWLERAAPAGARGGVSIALVSDAVMRRLNATYRGQSHATDVLSFQTGTRPEPLRPGPRAQRPRRGSSGPAPRFSRLEPAFYLGDLAIARGAADRQARRYGHSLGVELRILALHGLLHLLGYDHETDSGTMQRLEERLRRRARLPTGLVARGDPGRRTSGTAQ